MIHIFTKAHRIHKTQTRTPLKTQIRSLLATSNRTLLTVVEFLWTEVASFLKYQTQVTSNFVFVWNFCFCCISVPFKAKTLFAQLKILKINLLRRKVLKKHYQYVIIFLWNNICWNGFRRNVIFAFKMMFRIVAMILLSQKTHGNFELV